MKSPLGSSSSPTLSPDPQSPCQSNLITQPALANRHSHRHNLLQSLIYLQPPGGRNIPARDSCFSAPYSIPRKEIIDISLPDPTKSPLFNPSPIGKTSRKRTVSRKHPRLRIQRLAHQDRGIWVVFFHGRIGPVKKRPEILFSVSLHIAKSASM